MILNEFYLGILNKLTVTEDIGLEFFDEWRDQPENEDEETSFNTPAAFLEFTNEIEWQSIGKHKMQGVCEFDIILLVETLGTKDSFATELEKTNAIDAESIADDITRYLVGFGTQNLHGSISQTGTFNPPANDNLKEITLSFKTLLINTKAKRTQTIKSLSPGSISTEVVSGN